MAEANVEHHSSLIKTPQQLIVVVVLAFAIPLAIILLVVKLITGGMQIDPDSAAMSEEAVAKRLKPVGEVSLLGDADSTAGGDTMTATAMPEPAETMSAAAPADSATAAAGGGEQVFNSVCQTCHVAGLAGAPKTGDVSAWAPRIAQGIDTLYASVINGKGVMPAKGGAVGSSDADIKAAVDIMVSKSK